MTEKSHNQCSADIREVDTFQSDKCPTCLGDGYIGQHANLPDVKCPNCSGTGFVDTRPNVELLIENLVQAAAEYENNCDRLVAKTIRVQLEKAKQAIRDAITTQPQEAPVPLEPKAFEPAIKRVLEDWFGEAFGHMDEEKHRRKYLLDPLCKAACSVSRPVRS